ncbi:MAG: PIN domain-containing protein [Bacillota bacterium]|jgi:predicted nucleic acid-binding protein
MRRIFVDTSAWYSLKNSQDPHHRAVLDFFREQQGQALFFTSDYIADEAITLTRVRLKNHKVAADLAQELFSEKAAKMVFVSPAHHDRALEIFVSYGDQYFSYTDCTSFAIMEALKIEEALALDYDFERFGLRQVRMEAGPRA